MKRSWHSLVLMLAALLPIMVFAQVSTEDWEVVLRPSLYEDLYLLGPDGVREQIKLPKETRDREVVLSPDRRYVLFQVGDWPSRTAQIWLADLQTGDCCRPIGDASLGVEGPNFPLQATFSPNSTQVALLYRYDDQDCSGCLPQDRYALFDLESGALTFDTGADTFLAWLREPRPDEQSNIALSDGFSDTSGRVWMGNQHIDRTMSLNTYNRLYDAGSTLANGEHLVYSFLANDDPNGTGQRFLTAVIYYQFPDGDRRIVYQDFEHNYLTMDGYIECFGIPSIQAHPAGRAVIWAADGTYMLTYDIVWQDLPDNWPAILIAYDGSITPLDVPLRDHVLFGTPQGWVSLRYDGNDYQVVHFVTGSNGWEEVTLLEGTSANRSFAPAPLEPQVIEPPLLGDPDAPPQPFPEIEPRLMGTSG